MSALQPFLLETVQSRANLTFQDNSPYPSLISKSCYGNQVHPGSVLKTVADNLSSWTLLVFMCFSLGSLCSHFPVCRVALLLRNAWIFYRCCNVQDHSQVVEFFIHYNEGKVDCHTIFFHFHNQLLLRN